MTSPQVYPPYKERQSILRNTFSVGLAQILQLGANFFVLIAIARYLPIAVYGDFVFATTLANTMMTLSYFGIQEAMVREIAKDRDNAALYFGDALTLRGILASLAMLGTVAYAAWSDISPELALAICIAVAGEAMRTHAMLFRAIFQAFERMRIEPLISSMYAVISAILVGGVIFFGLGLLAIIAALAGIHLLHLLISARLVLTRFLRPSLHFRRNALWTMFKYAAVIGLGIFLYQNLFRITALMLKWMSTSEQLAIFNAPYELVMKLGMAPQALMLALFPTIARLLVENAAEAKALFDTIFRRLFLITFLVSLLLSLFARDAVLMAFGDKFVHAVPIMEIVSWSFCILTLDMFFTNLLVAINKQLYDVITAGACIVINTVGTYLVIPRFGALGAAWVLLFVNLLLLGMSMLFSRRFYHIPPLGGLLAKAALAGCVGLAVRNSLAGLTVFVAAPATLAAALATLLATRAVAAEDLALLARLVRRGAPQR